MQIPKHFISRSYARFSYDIPIALKKISTRNTDYLAEKCWQCLHICSMHFGVFLIKVNKSNLNFHTYYINRDNFMLHLLIYKLMKFDLELFVINGEFISMMCT